MGLRLVLAVVRPASVLPVWPCGAAVGWGVQSLHVETQVWKLESCTMALAMALTMAMALPMALAMALAKAMAMAMPWPCGRSKNLEKFKILKILRMQFSIVENLSGLRASIFSLFRSPQLNFHAKSKNVSDSGNSIALFQIPPVGCPY